jgi:hypothetical protein
MAAINTDEIAVITMSDVDIQMDALESANVLPASFIQWNKNLYHNSFCLVSMESKIGTLYTTTVKVVVSDKYRMSYTMDIKTAKILDLHIEKISTADSLPISTIDRIAMMERFVRYLDLDVLDDWQYNGNSYCSEKAKLRVDLELTDNSLSLKILPVGYRLLMSNSLIF